MDAVLRRLGDRLRWSANGLGPLGALVQPGDRVVVKPNWVLHENKGVGGFNELVTHGSVVRGLVRALQLSAAAEITVGDAPVQGCNFIELLSRSGFPDPAVWRSGDTRLRGPVDFRRTVSSLTGASRAVAEDIRPLSDYVLFDLGNDSYLEPVTSAGNDFRVTMYPPALMARTHSRGRHQYLVAREMIDADLVVNAPKLKTHKKSGVTCALKNLVGINGNKEFLPHHRVGGPADGGDCYPENSSVKRLLERVLDVQNTVSSRPARVALDTVARGLYRVAHQLGDHVGVEGAWSGNDTVWRMCLDLNRILLYGRADGTIAPLPQRRVVHVVDAIVAGQGDGPLSPLPLPLNLMLAGTVAAAVDWVGAELLGYDPHRIPITARAFDRTPWPLALFHPDAVLILDDAGTRAVSDLVLPVDPTTITRPFGWQSAARATASEPVAASPAPVGAGQQLPKR